jgi:hypothetical protein
MSAVEEKQKQDEEDLDVLRPKAETFEVTIGTGPLEATYAVRPLNFFGKMELFAVLGNAVDHMLATGMSVDEIIDAAEGGMKGEGIDLEDDVKVDAFAKALVKMVQEVPEVLPELFCVALCIPRDQRIAARTIMELPEDEGGLSDEEAFGIYDAFIETNGVLLRRFFEERIVPLMEKMGRKRKAGGSQQSKPSRATRRATQRRSKNA